MRTAKRSFTTSNRPQPSRILLTRKRDIVGNRCRGLNYDSFRRLSRSPTVNFGTGIPRWSCNEASGKPRSGLFRAFPGAAEHPSGRVQLELWPLLFLVLDWGRAKSELRDNESAIALPVRWPRRRMKDSSALLLKQQKRKELAPQKSACHRRRTSVISVRARVEETVFRRGGGPRRIPSNLHLTYERLGPVLQLLHVDRVLRELIERGDHSSVGLIAALSDDHVRELGRNVHVRLFQRAARDGPTAAAAGDPDCRSSGRKGGLETVLSQSQQTLRIGKVRQHNLAQSQRLVVGERTFNGSVRGDAEVGESSAAVAVLKSICGCARCRGLCEQRISVRVLQIPRHIDIGSCRRSSR